MNENELQLRFKINEKALLEGLMKSASAVSDQFAEELQKKFTDAINKITKKGQTVMQLGGLFVDFFNEFSEAVGDVDKLSASMDHLVDRFNFLSDVEKKSGISGLMNEFSIANIDKILGFYDKMIEKQERIQQIRAKNGRESIRQNASKSIRSVDDLMKIGRGNDDDANTFRQKVKQYIDDRIKADEKYKPTDSNEANKLLVASRQYADLINAYKKVLKEEHKKGSEDAVKQQLEIISILTELKKYENQSPVLTDFRKTIEKELPQDFINKTNRISNDASSVEVQGLTLAINNMVDAMIKPIQGEIAKLYEQAIEKATGMAVKKSEDVITTYEEAVRVFNLQEENKPESKKRKGISASIPSSLAGNQSNRNTINDEIDEFEKYYKSLEDAKEHIAELLNDRSIKSTTVDSNNFDKIKDLIGYIQGYISLGGQIEDLNLDKTTLRRFGVNGNEPVGMSTNYSRQIQELKNTIINAFKQVNVNNYGTAGNAEVVHTAVVNEVGTNPNSNIIGGLSDESIEKILTGLKEIREEIKNLQFNDPKNVSEFDTISINVESIEQSLSQGYSDFSLMLANLSKSIVDLGKSLGEITVNLPSDFSNNINKTYIGIADVIIDQLKADRIMKGNGKIPMLENGWFFTKNGFSTTPFLHGGESGVNTGLVLDDAKDVVRKSGQKISYVYHSHSGDPIAAMSFPRYENGTKKYGDIKSFFSDNNLNNEIFDIEEQLIGGTKTVQAFFAKKFFSDFKDVLEKTYDGMDFYNKFAEENKKIVENKNGIDNKIIQYNTHESMGGIFNFDLLQSTNANLYEKFKNETEKLQSNFLEMLKDEENSNLDFREVIEKFAEKTKDDYQLSQNDFASLVDLLAYNTTKDGWGNEYLNQLNNYILQNTFGINDFLKNYTKTYNLQSKEDVAAFREKYGFSATLNDVVESLSEIRDKMIELSSTLSKSNGTANIENVKESLSELNEKVIETESNFDSLKERVDTLSYAIDELKNKDTNKFNDFEFNEDRYNRIREEINNTKKSAEDLLFIWEKLRNDYTDPFDDGAIKSKNNLYSELKKQLESLGYEFNGELQRWDKTSVSSVKKFYDNYGFPSEALDKSHFANVDEVLNKLGGRFKEMNSEAEDFSEMKLNGEFFKELLTQLSLTEDQLTVIKAALIEIDNYVPGGKFRHLSGDKASNALVQRQIETINGIIKGDKVITADDLSTARDILHYANGDFDVQHQDQSSPTAINVKPVLNPQEFADEVTEQLKGFHTNIDVRAKVEDENLFVSEITNQLHGWNASIDVQPQIDWQSRFVENVTEQLQGATAQIAVEPLSEGEFDSERFAQQVTNRLIGESAKINVELNGSDNQNGQPNINIEAENLNGLNEVLDDITRRIGQKTAAFVNEQGVIEKVVNVEKAKLADLKDAVDGVTKSVNDKTKAFNNEAKAVNATLRAEEKAEKSKSKDKKTKSNNKEKEQRKIWEKDYENAYKDNYLFDKKKKEDEERENQNRLDQLKKYKNQFNKIDATKYPTTIRETINGLDQLLKSYNNVNIVSDDDLNQIKELFDIISNGEKLANKAKVSSLIADIQKYLQKNTKLPKEVRIELESLIEKLSGLDVVKSDVQDVVSSFKDMDAAMTAANKTGKSLVKAIGEKAFYRTAQYIATFFSAQDLIRYAKTAVNTVIGLDTALVDLRKTAQMSASELNNFYFSSNSVAKQMGTTTKEIISQAAAWSRLGYSTADQAEKMAALSSQFAAISPGMNLDTATDGLVSSMKAFGIEVNDVERQVMDNINRIGNTMATSNQEIVDMLTRSSAAMSTANNTIQETIALESAAVEITRNAETTGTAFKTLSMRIRGYDEETEELSDDLANISGEIADLTKIDGRGGVSLFTDDTKETYKSTYQILKEISEVWDKISDKNQAALLEKLAGKRGGQVIAGVIKNFNAAEKAMNEMSNAAGSADAEMEIIQDSIEYKINAFKETWVGMAQTLIDRGDIGKIVDGFTKISEAIGFVVDKLGLLGTAGLIGGGALGFKNLGRGKTFPLFNMPSLASFNPVMGILS